ncbi:Glucan endo-1,3-beta-glucosidase [Fagus crenata]
MYKTSSEMWNQIHYSSSQTLKYSKHYKFQISNLLLLQSAFASTRVTTVVAMNVLGASYPPSAGAFSGEAFIAVNDDASFLVRPGLKINTANVYISISETGWPHAGTNPYTSKENALMYNANLTFMS